MQIPNTNENTFNEFFCNLANNLVAKLPPPSSKFRISSVLNYYQNTLDLLSSKFKFSNVTEDCTKLLKDMNIDPGIDNLSGKCLNDGANILAKPVSKRCSLSIKYSIFPTDCQISKLKLSLKKCSTILLRNYWPKSLLFLILQTI